MKARQMLAGETLSGDLAHLLTSVPPLGLTSRLRAPGGVSVWVVFGSVTPEEAGS